MGKVTYPEVLDRLGIRYTVRSANVKITCPACGKKSYYFDIRRDVGHCFSPSCDCKGGPIRFYAAARGLSYEDAEKELLGERKQFTPPTYKLEESQPLASIEKRNAVNRAFLKCSPLSSRHEKDLAARGIKAEDIHLLGYGTVSAANPERIADKCRAASPDGSLIGVSGFYKSDSGVWTVNQKTSGILVPYVNQYRQISGFQVRRNKEDIVGDGSKYFCFSSNGKSEGTKTRLCVHFACEFRKDFLTGQYYPLLGQKVRLTEGAMKADIAHYVTGEPILAVAGVNNLVSSGFGDVLEYLKRRGVTTIVDTFDMDFIHNKNVKHAMGELKSMVVKAGLKYERVDWDPEYKGYDDYVVAMRDRSLKGGQE